MMMPDVALWLMHQYVRHLMNEKYLQVSVHPGNRGDHCDFDP